MLPEDVEARFRRIEDNLVVTAELQRRGEARAQDEIEHLKAIQDAMARWMDKLADRQDEMAGRQDEFDGKLNALIDAQIRGEHETREMKAAIAGLEALVEIQMRGEQEMRAAIADASRTVADLSRTVADLSRTVELYLKARTNGGGN